VDKKTGELIPERMAAYTQRMRKGWQMVRKYGFFTLKEESVLNALADHINYQNEIREGEEPMTPASMARAIGEDGHNFLKTLKSLQRKNAVGCWKSYEVEIWYVNPALYRRGRGHKDIAGAFASTAREREREGAKAFNLPHERYYSSLLRP
jgi:DNA-binding MarR family transcriptional regulator